MKRLLLKIDKKHEMYSDESLKFYPTEQTVPIMM